MKSSIQRKLNSQRTKINPIGYGIGRIKLIDLQKPTICKSCTRRCIEIKIQGKYKFVCKNKYCIAFVQSEQATITQKLERNPKINLLLKELFHPSDEQNDKLH